MLERLKNRKIIILALLVLLIALFFPVNKPGQVTFVGKDGVEAGTLVRETAVPWWYPENLLKKRVPVSEASAEELAELVRRAKEENDIDKLKALAEADPLLDEYIEELENPTGTEQPGSEGDGGESSGETTVPPPSTTDSYGTVESRIPAAVEGYEFVTESRSILSWLGVFKSTGDNNINSLEISIEQVGSDAARKELDDFRQTYSLSIKETTVKGLKAWTAVPSPRQVILMFADGDFLYQLKLNLKGSAESYREEIRRAAESAFI